MVPLRPWRASSLDEKGDSGAVEAPPTAYPPVRAPPKPIEPDIQLRLDDAAMGALRSALKGVAEAGLHEGSPEARLFSAFWGIVRVESAPQDLADLQAIALELAQRGSKAAKAIYRRLAELDAPRVRAEILRASLSPDRAEATLQVKPESPVRMAGLFPGASSLGATEESLLKALDQDLATSSVGSTPTEPEPGFKGGLRLELEQIFDRFQVSVKDKAAFFQVFAEVRAGFRAGTIFDDEQHGDADMQRVNWIHTRIEVIKAARICASIDREPSLTGDELLAVLLGALCSDAFKVASKHSLMWHNRPGAELVLPLLFHRHFPNSGRHRKILEVAQRLAHEHQITPALFMASAVKSELQEASAPDAIVQEVFEKFETRSRPRRKTEK